MHSRSATGAALLASIVVLASAAIVLAKEGGVVTLAKPIPLDAEPGSTITVTFDAMILTEDGPRPIQGSSMVVRLTGPSGAVTEAVATQTERPGTYVAEIEVPAGGVDRADFGLRGTSTAADGSSMVEDVPFDVDGVLFAMTDEPAPNAAAPNAAAEDQPVAPPPAPDVRPAILAIGLGLAAIVLAGLALVAGRRRSMRSA